MNPSADQDNWENLGELWRSSPMPDVAKLARSVSRKRTRMRVMVALELFITLFATAQLVFVIAHPELRFLGSTWAWIMLFFVWAFEAIAIWLRRNLWQARSNSLRDLLEITIRRARMGIVYVWANLVGCVFCLIVSLPFALQDWQTGDTKERNALLVSGYAQAVLLLLTLVWSWWYRRRQLRRLAKAKNQLRELDAE